MNLHLTYNDHLDVHEVIGIVYLLDPAAQEHPSTRVYGPDVGRIQIPKPVWEAFKAAWLESGHTASWGFN